MIRKRIKKRRNPSEEEELRERRLTGYRHLGLYLSHVIEYGGPEELVNAVILYEQGETCDDCDKNFYECQCEKCSECGFRRNLCYLNIEYKGSNAEDYTKEERERVREAGYELILEILADNFYNDGRKYSIIPDNKHKDLNELKKEFLNSVLQKDNIDLSYSDLRKIDLSNEDLSDANLSYSNLSGANLSGANLSGANLSEVVLYDTDLSKVNFTNAIVKNTNFKNVKTIRKAIGLKIPNPRNKPSKIKDKHGRS